MSKWWPTWLSTVLVVLAPAAWGQAAAGAGALEVTLRPPPPARGGDPCLNLERVTMRLSRQGLHCLRSSRGVSFRVPGLGPLTLEVDGATPADLHRDVVLTVDRLLRASSKHPVLERLAGELVFTAGLSWSDRLGLEPDGRFHDRLTGRDLGFDEAYAIYRAATPERPNWGLTGLELGGALAGGSLWYWTATSVNAPDWQYDYFLDSLYRKLVTFQAWRFDDNPIYLNSPGHALAGAGYYLLGRSNGVGVAGAFASSVGASFLWEILPEYREVLAINDIVLGGFGGPAVGEPMYQLGRFFAASKEGSPLRLLSFVFGAPGAVERWLGGETVPAASELDRFGLPADRRHLVALSLGLAATERHSPAPVRGDLAAGFDTELFLLPQYLQPVSFHGTVVEPVRTRLALDGVFGAKGVLDFSFHTGAVLMARDDQEIVGRGIAAHGYSVLLGLGTEFRHQTYATPGVADYAGIVGLAGPVLDVSLLGYGGRLRLELEAYPDFALTRAFALDDYAAVHGLAGAKTVLKNEGYYQALGFTGRARVSAEKAPFFGGASLRFDHLESIEGLDRFQSEITDDFHLRDEILVGRAWFGLRTSADTDARVVYEARHRWGEIRSTNLVDDERRVTLLVGWSL